MLDDRHTDAQLDTCKWSDAVTLRSSLQSYNTEIAGHLNELLGTFDFPHELVATASQKRQSQQLVQEFSQAHSSTAHASSCRPAEGIRLAHATCFLLASSHLAPSSTWSAARGSTCRVLHWSLRSPAASRARREPSPAEQLSACTYCAVVLPTQTENGDGRRGEWKTVGASLAQP